LVTLATTGNPEPLQAELGGNITSSEENVMRMDVGATEGHYKPFAVLTIVEDGGTPWYVELWYWLTNW
jgi:hypothetical protein